MSKKKLFTNTAHQRIDDHEKLCRIMQNETNEKIKELKVQMSRLERVVLGMIVMVVLGMGTIIIQLFGRI
jgi:cell division protein FtsL